MQKLQYENEASMWSIRNRDPVVGAFDGQNQYPYAERLFNGIDTKNMVALDFGCGPGRSLVQFSELFHQIDGVDIAENNLKNAMSWLKYNKIAKESRLFMNNGVDLKPIESDYYDLVYSIICLQHIAVHSIRYSLKSEIFRVLKPGGWFTAQMGFGARNRSAKSVSYYDNFYEAAGTNGICDVNIIDYNDLKNDLTKIGFENFSYSLHPSFSDLVPQWIFFRGQKPLN